MSGRGHVSDAKNLLCCLLGKTGNRVLLKRDPYPSAGL